ncbi:MAG: tetratricopeptide repeat protein [Anaerolineae bacterium]
MAEIPLLEYVAQIEDHLNAGAADEASYHSRHILSQFPKYVPAFRLLGRALLQKGQYEEAEAAFRRVLSAYPTDLTAHLGLSELYDQRRRGDEAIWHAERALEVDVNRAATSDLLTALYRTYRNENRPRMGLTAVTLARQALQKHDYDQAISTLRDSLERQPERIDQRILLAEAIWASDDHVGAAEVATDVLDTLPDCVSANTILARLWLEVGRPSDARPYLNRLESLDPYWAVEIVTGASVEGSAFTIEPINYQNSAQSDVARIEPDWIQGIPTGEDEYDADLVTPDWTSGMLSGTETSPELPPPVLQDEVTAEQDAPTLAVSIAATGLAAGAFAAGWGEDERPAPETDVPDLDTLLTMPTTMLGESATDDPITYAPTAILGAVPSAEPNLFAEPVTEDAMPDLNEIFGDLPEDAGSSVPPFDENEPALQPIAAAGVTAPLPPIHDPFAPEPMPQAEDAMAWLRESGVELIEDEAPEFSVDTGAEFPSVASTDDLDPMAWLNTYDTVPAAGADETKIPADQPPATALGDDWQEESWDPNAVNIASFTGESSPEEDDEQAVATTAGLRGLTSRLGDASVVPPPPQSALTADDAVLDEWLSQFDAPAATPEPEDAAPGWLNEIGAEMTTDPERTPAAPDDQSPDVESADWLTGFSPENLRADLDAVVAETDSEWLTNATASPDENASIEDANLPDWLVSAAPEAAGAVAAAMAGERPDLEGIPAGDEFEWLASFNEPVAPEAGGTSELDEAVLAAQADVPDWLDALESEALAQINANQEDAAEEAATEDVVAAEAYEPLPFDETPVTPTGEETDWLAAGPAVAGVAVMAAAASDWSDHGIEAPAEEWGADIPSSFEELATTFVEEPSAESEWSADAEPVGSIEAEEVLLEETPEGEVVLLEAEPEPEWLASADEPAAETGEEIPESTFEWGEPETAELSRIAPPTVGIADTPPVYDAPTAPDDWFVDGALAAEPPVPAEVSDEGVSKGDWFVDAALLVPAATMAAQQPGPDESEAVTGEESGMTAEDGALIAGAATLGVLAVASGEETDTAPGDAAALDELDEEDWLTEEWSEEAEAPVLLADELDELPDVEIAEETVIAPATNAPDWLNAMVPGLDMDFEAGVDEPIETEASETSGALDETLGARSDYAWVIDLVEQEETETVPADVALDAAYDQPRFLFRSLPAWYRRDNGNGTDDDFADWPSDDSSQSAYQN